MPPIQASTWESSVVGIFINFIPLLYVLATNPDMSPTIPPPIAITQSDLLNFFLARPFKRLLAVTKFLFFSFAVILKIDIFFPFKERIISLTLFIEIFVSKKKATFFFITI